MIFQKVIKKNDQTTIELNDELLVCFERCKSQLANSTLLSHPCHNSELCLMVDASDLAVGAVLQQKLNGIWNPLAYFSKKLNSAEIKYS